MVAAWLTPGKPRDAGGRTANLGRLALGVIALAAILALLGRTVAATVATWYDSNSFNHCFLILPISAYLAWQRRAALAGASIAPDWRGALVIAGAAMAWLVGDVSGTLFLQQICLVVAIQALVLLIYGWAIFRILLFPLFYLFFAVPFGLEFIPPLQTVTAILSVGLLKLAGVPVFSDGYFISIPTGNWYVADACSGVRYVISSLALGALFAATMFVTWWRRALVIVVAIVVPIIANGIRAFGIILIAYLSDNELATGIDHIIYGWLFFTLVSGAVLAIGLSFREHETETGPAQGISPRIASLAASALAAVIAISTIGAARAYSAYLETASLAAAPHLQPPAIADYERIDSGDDQILPRFSRSDAQLDAAYRNGTDTIYLRIGYFAHVPRGEHAVNLDYELSGPRDLVTASKGTVEVPFGNEPLHVRSEHVTTGTRGRVIWLWYWVDGRFVGDPYRAKLFEAKARLLGGGQAVAVIAIAADYRSDPAAAENALRAFMAKGAPLQAMIETAAP